jgi:hypothetical protein
MSPTTGGTIGTSPTLRLAPRDLRLAAEQLDPGGKARRGEETTIFVSFRAGLCFCRFAPVKQSRARDCSGKSPNMHVAVAVRNMD